MVRERDLATAPARPTDDHRLLGVLVLVAIIAVAPAAAKVRTGFWLDEAMTASMSARGFGNLWNALGHVDGGISGYLIGTNLWARVFGTSELALRAPSVLAAVGTVVIGGLLAARLTRPRAGLVAGVALAIHPSLLPYFSTEARPYALATVLTAGAGVAAHRRSTTGGSVLVWSVAASLAIAFHFLAVLALLPQVLWLAAPAGRVALPSRAVAVGRALVLPGFVTIAMWRQIVHQGAAQPWIPDVTRRVIQNVAWITFGPGAVVVFAATLLAFLVVETRQQGGEGDGADGRGVQVPRALDLVVLGAWAAGPLVTLAVGSALFSPILITRYVLPSVVPCAVITGVAVSVAIDASNRWRPRSVGSTVALLLVGLGVAGGVNVVLDRGALLHPIPKPEDLRAAAEWIEAEQRPGDVVLYSPYSGEYGLRWYLLERPGAAGPPNVAADPTTSAVEVGHHRSPTRSAADIAAALGQAGRVWIVGPPSPLPAGGDAEDLLGASVRTCWALVEQRSYGFVLQLWARPAAGAAPSDCP